jgi:hypothetical protein
MEYKNDVYTSDCAHVLRSTVHEQIKPQTLVGDCRTRSYGVSVQSLTLVRVSVLLLAVAVPFAGSARRTFTVSNRPRDTERHADGISSSGTLVVAVPNQSGTSHNTRARAVNEVSPTTRYNVLITSLFYFISKFIVVARTSTR